MSNLRAKGSEIDLPSIFPVPTTFAAMGKGRSIERIPSKSAPVVIRNEQVAGSNPAGGSRRRVIERWPFGVLARHDFEAVLN